MTDSIDENGELGNGDQDPIETASDKTEASPNGDGATGAPTTVNAQILDAVNKSTAAVMDNAANQGMATAYQKVAQAAAFAVQDATDYSRNVENIAMTAQGVIVAKMMEDQANIPIYTPVLATLQEMVVAASTNLATVGTTAAAVAKEFPSKA